MYFSQIFMEKKKDYMKKILLIEDNEELRENTAEILSLSNFEVLTAPNGKIGVEVAKKDFPDLIICDIMMPELDGYGVLYALSKDNNTASIPFIFLTAKADRRDIRKGMNLGADDYLTKPFDDLELLDAVESRLKKHNILKEEFQKTEVGLEEFLDKARGLHALANLSEDRKKRIYKKKDIIFFEGTYPNFVFLLNYGKIKTYKTNDEGKEYITSLHEPGEFVGFLPMLENSNHKDTAMAMENTEVTLIPREDFLTLVYSNREVAQKFIKMLSGNVLEKEHKLLELAYDSVKKRVANTLIELEQGDDRLSISREDLANIVGTAKETVIRTLSEFKEKKYIQIKGSLISILDMVALERMDS